MESPTTRPLESHELAAIEDVLLRLREHFHQWPGYEGHEHDLMQFAYHEGSAGSECCGAIFAEAAPIALGNELVRYYGFRWVAVREGGEWHFAVMHPSLAAPIDLMTLEDGRYDDSPYDEPPDPGERTLVSLDGVLHSIGQSPQWTWPAIDPPAP